MRRTRRLGAVLASTALLLGPTVTMAARASAAGRANDWVEIWCDTDTTNRDRSAITLSVDASGTTHGGADDVRAKVVDASPNHFTFQVAGGGTLDPGLKFAR